MAPIPAGLVNPVPSPASPEVTGVSGGGCGICQCLASFSVQLNCVKGSLSGDDDASVSKLELRPLVEYDAMREFATEKERALLLSNHFLSCG